MGSGRFEKGRSGNPKGRAPGTKVALRHLRDMRWVYDHEAEAGDTTPGRKMFRRLLEKDPWKFLDLLAKAEMDWLKQVERGAGLADTAAAVTGSAEGHTAGAGRDVGTEKASRILEELLNHDWSQEG